ncbi:MAG: DUF3048 C-terminal domain-containing protein [Leptolinea sp.]
MRKSLLLLFLIFVFLAGFSFLPVKSVNASNPVPPENVNEGIQVVATGPLNFPAGVNPLTGLTENNPDDLLLPPALVSISTFPPSARPQSGLSYSPWVFEMFIGEGMSRYLAIFYGSYPQAAVAGKKNDFSATPAPAIGDATIGPIRSGRLSYESVRKLYNGFLVMASAYSSVASRLSDFTNVFGSDSSGAGSSIKVADLRSIADKYRGKMKMTAESLSGMQFDSKIPAKGKSATQIWYPVALLNQVVWQFDANSGAYTRWQDDADGVTFVQATDRLNGDPLQYENIVILYADHHRYADTLMDIDLMYVNKGKAVLFRDGQKFDLFWTTRSAEYEQTTGKVRPIRFMDADGNPFPFKPGQTWVHLTPTGAPIYETAAWDMNAIKEVNLGWQEHKRSREAGSGYWTVDFYQPAIEPKE